MCQGHFICSPQKGQTEVVSHLPSQSDKQPPILRRELRSSWDREVSLWPLAGPHCLSEVLDRVVGMPV